MRITAKTKYSRQFAELVEPYMTQESKKALMKASERVHGTMSSLTIDEFYQLTKGNFSRIGDTKRPTIMQVYWVKRFNEFAGEFATTLQRLKPVQTAAEQAAAAACPKTDWCEALITFARSYFGLHSFEEASRVTIGDIIIAKRDVYIDSVYRTALNKKNK